MRGNAQWARRSAFRGEGVLPGNGSLDKGRDPLLAGLSAFSTGDPPEELLLGRGAERGEVLLGRRVLGQGCREVVGDRQGFDFVVARPGAVSFRLLDLGKTGWGHQ